MRNRSRRSRGSDEINLTPLLDVLFTILFIVMLTGMQNERSMEESAQESEAQITGLESRVDALEEENDILKSEVSRRDKIQDSNKRYESNAVIVTLINETEDGEHVLKPVIDLNLGVQYHLWVGKAKVQTSASAQTLRPEAHPNLILFAQINNWLHRKNEYYYGYRSQGINCLIGVTYKF